MYKLVQKPYILLFKTVKDVVIVPRAQAILALLMAMKMSALTYLRYAKTMVNPFLL